MQQQQQRALWELHRPSRPREKEKVTESKRGKTTSSFSFLIFFSVSGMETVWPVKETVEVVFLLLFVSSGACVCVTL